MLDIKNHKSDNYFNVTGILNNIDVKKATSPKTKDDYISLELEVRVDQAIDGTVTENIIPIGLFANRHKKENGKPGQELNMLYDKYVEYANNLVSLGSADENHPASKVTLSTEIRENNFMGKNGKRVDSWKLSTNFINEARASDEESARFKITGVLVGKNPEVDKEGNETGRILLKICIVGYGGKANVIDFVATGAVAEHIDRNWEKGDTIKAAGLIAMTNKIIDIEENLGIGETQIRHQTVSRRELIITGCSEGCLDDSEAYDADDIKVALDARKAYLATLETQTQKSAPKNDGFGF